MKPITFFSFRNALIIILALMFFPNLFSQEREKDIQEIRKLYVEMGKALMDKDWELWQSFIVQDTTLHFVHPSIRDWAHGWKAVEMRYKPYFSPEVNISAELEIDKFEVVFAPGGNFAWAVIDMRAIINGHESQSWQIMGLRKIDNKWRVNLVFDADLPPKKEE
jgi:hypothetical protein